MTSDATTPPPIDFAEARGARLAVQTWGDGTQWLVSTPPLAQNIEVAWEHHRIAAMFQRFGRFSRFVHYDKRGTGASGRHSRVPGPDERVDDLRAVMDHLDIDRAHLLGNSDGGPTSLLFAATYPDRVASVVLQGSGATTIDPFMTDAERATWPERVEPMVQRWGTSTSPIAAGFAPSLADDAEYLAWHQRYERLSADAASLRELLHLSLDNDAYGVLDRVSCPVLVLHRTGDPIVDVAWARHTAAQLPDATMVELPGVDHFGYAGDTDAILDEIERWMTGAVRTAIGRTTAAGPAVRIRTFGSFAVEVDGEQVPTSDWGSKLARTLCKRLAAARGWPVTRDELFDLLWPDEHDRSRLGPRLSVQLSTVRRVLRGGVVADRESVRLDLDEVTVDLVDLDRATDDADVVDLVTGEFLPEDRYEPWTDALRATVHARFATAARRRATALLETDEPAAAAALAGRVVALDALDLDAHVLLVHALDAAGARAEAAQARATTMIAAEELGVATPDV